MCPYLFRRHKLPTGSISRLGAQLQRHRRRHLLRRRCTDEWRCLAEFIAELASRIGGMRAAIGLLEEYQQRASPAMLHVTGGDKFPPRPLHAVPSQEPPMKNRQQRRRQVEIQRRWAERSDLIVSHARAVAMRIVAGLAEADDTVTGATPITEDGVTYNVRPDLGKSSRCWPAATMASISPP